MTDYNKPLPKITPLSKPFWDHARARRLALQTCDSCGDVHFPEAQRCPKCLHAAQSWKVASGRGTLEGWAEFHRAYWDGFGSDLPYRACVVRLAEGPIIVSNLVGDSSKAKLGAPVHTVFEDVTDEVTLPKFSLD